LAVGAIDLNNRDPRRREMPRQTSAVGPGAFDPNPLDRTERTKPRRQVVIAPRRGRKRPHTQQAADRVDRSRDMHIEMRVHTPDYRARNFYDGHLPSLLSQTVKGWHARPGKETVTINLLLQEDRSPSGTGRAQFRTRAINATRAPRNVTDPSTTVVDTNELAPTHTHWAI
jgi:hypothetical protein